MFTVIERLRTRASWRGKRRAYTTWVVWCGWKDQLSAEWNNFEEACRDAALKEWTFQCSLW